ncbi:MAG TPA: nuclear transport factor 2 family protein [Chitinophagaceae bacterium]|nr:nuclear transport factor 2 family protein [Chitinophagaceae bacterium]
MQKLDKALLQKDEVVLKTVLNKELNYGHSNGWIQTKSDVLNDYKSGKLIYNKIENNSSAFLTINKKWATVKTNTNAEGAVNGTAFKLTLHVMQVWLKTKKGWQLYSRQSAKLE